MSYTVESLISDANETDILNQNEALSSFQVYSRRTIRNANSNVILRNINIDDEVKLAKDFDNNTLTRRNPFDSFFEESNLKVLNILGNNMFVIQNLDDLNDVQTVFKGRLKKIN